jgi:hypothetical protein
VAVYWRDGEYCHTHREVPERRCLDCGKVSRPGILDWMPVQTPSWTQVAETDGVRSLWDTKPIKAPAARTLDREQYRYWVVADGWCGHCESDNLAPLEFGLDRLPESQRECPAWTDKRPSSGSGGPPNALLNKSMGDPGITWKTCASCGDRLYSRFKAGASTAWQMTENDYQRAARPARVALPDGKWMHSDEYLVHHECPDPALVAEPYDYASAWNGKPLIGYRILRAEAVAA